MAEMTIDLRDQTNHLSLNITDINVQTLEPGTHYNLPKQCLLLVLLNQAQSSHLFSTTNKTIASNFCLELFHLA